MDGKKKIFSNLSRRQKIGLSVIVSILIVGGLYFGYEEYRYESTDDAYVQAYSTQLAPKVPGIVTQVLVDENQAVEAGQILAQLERKDYEAALRDAEATRGSLEAQLKNAEADFHRSEMLVRDRAISRQQFDRAEANYHDLQRRTRAAEARVEQARLNLDYTSVRAPSRGRIARRSVDEGMYVAAGTAVFGFVPGDTRWVDANFKETQLDSIAPGKRAKITVDAIPGKTYTGIVESISPATGATFTLLPPDNATGNFTKVVQRVPVRIRLRDLSERDIELLHAGLSAEVDLLKHSRPEELPPRSTPIFRAEQIPERSFQQAGQAGK